jgi:hypothetical protein
LWWRLLKRREIARRGAIKYGAIRSSVLFEETLFDELRDRLCNLRTPLANAGVEHPPAKNAVDGVLCIRVPDKIVENFRRRRWKGRFGQAHIGGMSSPFSNRRARISAST